ncbi:MAG: hypothetical protein WCG85_20585 [Polyangia bacterium]
MMLRTLPIISALATLASSCAFSVDANIPDVEITQRGLKVPGVPQSNLVGDVSVSSSFTYSSSNTAWAKSMNSRVYVRQVEITASSGLTSLDFIKGVHLTMADSQNSENSAEILSYDRSDGAPSSSVIDVSMPNPIDITLLWSAAATVIELQMAGRLPEQDWSVDVTMKLDGEITYKF